MTSQIILIAVFCSLANRHLRVSSPYGEWVAFLHELFSSFEATYNGVSSPYGVSRERDERRINEGPPSRADVFEQSEKTAQKRQAKSIASLSSPYGEWVAFLLAIAAEKNLLS